VSVILKHQREVEYCPVTCLICS